MVNATHSWRRFFLKGAQWSDLLKRLDWRIINEQTSRPFKILLSGDEPVLLDLQTALFSFKHPLRARFETAFLLNEQRARENSTESFIISDGNALPNFSFLFELTTREDIGPRPWPVYVWPLEVHKQKDLLRTLLDQFPHFQEALAFHFPAFREVMIEREVLSTVRLNTAWVATSALPNIVPGPHQLLSIPMEAGSDFVVLTINELRMMIRLTGLSGLVVHPRELFTQVLIVLSMAKIAQISATQLASKIPGGVGLMMKGGIAYAFTRAMGEAIVLYLVTGRAQGKDFFLKRTENWLNYYRRKQ
jgi:hypothetical protein